MTVFLVLTIHKQCSKPNSDPEHSSSFRLISIRNPIECGVTSKVTPKQQQCISEWLTSNRYRHNSYRWPPHSNGCSRHKCPVKHPPKLPYKKHPFRPNKQKHTKMQPIFHFPSMKTKNTFAVHITPPHAANISQTKKSNNKQCRSTGIAMKYSSPTSSEKLQTKPSQSWPRTWIYQMVSMMRPSMSSTIQTIRNSIRIITIPTIIKTMKQSHYFFNIILIQI